MPTPSKAASPTASKANYGAGARQAPLEWVTQTCKPPGWHWPQYGRTIWPTWRGRCHVRHLAAPDAPFLGNELTLSDDNAPHLLDRRKNWRDLGPDMSPATVHDDGRTAGKGFSGVTHTHMPSVRRFWQA